MSRRKAISSLFDCTATPNLELPIIQIISTKYHYKQCCTRHNNQLLENRKKDEDPVHTIKVQMLTNLTNIPLTNCY